MASLNLELLRPSSSFALLPSPSVFISLLVGLLCAALALAWPRKAANLPPGPAPALFVGNREQVPKGGKPWKWFRDLNLQYGELQNARRGRGGAMCTKRR